MTSNSSSRNRQRGLAAFNWVFVGFALVALFFLVSEHRAHLYGWLPFLLLAACPLMHLFHRGHGGHGSHGEQRSGEGERPPGPTSTAKQGPGDAPSDAQSAHHH